MSQSTLFIPSLKRPEAKIELFSFQIIYGSEVFGFCKVISNKEMLLGLSTTGKDFIPTIWSPTSTVPAELPVKFSGDNLVLQETTCENKYFISKLNV